MKTSAPRSRNGVVDNSTKSAKVTPPAYVGDETAIGGVRCTPNAPVELSMATRIRSRCESLTYAMEELFSTVVRLGIYEPAPKKSAESGAAQPHTENVLSVINTELNDILSNTLGFLHVSVYADSPCDEGEDAIAPNPEGSVMDTAYGRTVYDDCQNAIDKLYNIQALSSRLSASFVGAGYAKTDRERYVSSNVYECLCSLNEHIDDTVEALHTTNSALVNNLLGVSA